jgi:hypothetical protein
MGQQSQRRGWQQQQQQQQRQQQQQLGSANYIPLSTPGGRKNK